MYLLHYNIIIYLLVCITISSVKLCISVSSISVSVSQTHSGTLLLTHSHTTGFTINSDATEKIYKLVTYFSFLYQQVQPGWCTDFLRDRCSCKKGTLLIIIYRPLQSEFHTNDPMTLSHLLHGYLLMKSIILHTIEIILQSLRLEFCPCYSYVAAFCCTAECH